MYRFSNKGNTNEFKMYFKIVSFWNFVVCVVTVANLGSFEKMYDGIITKGALFKNTEWFWILLVMYVLITNFNCLDYYFKKGDIERCYEWMFWMICGTGLNFLIRYLYTLVIFGIFKVMYGDNNLEDLIASGYASWLEVIYLLGLFWMISDTQRGNEKAKYEMVDNTDLSTDL